MNTTQNNLCSPKFLDGNPAPAIDVMRKHWERERAGILNDARAKVRAEVRNEFCDAFGVEKDESSDDEGGGSITLKFPEGWTEEQAESFAENCLDLDLSYRDGGPGRYFQQGGVGTSDEGIIFLGMRWGLDI
jgi:hypothetical protein